MGSVVVSFAEADLSLAGPFVEWLRSEWGDVTILERRNEDGAASASSPEPVIRTCDLLVCLVTDNWLASVACGEHLILAEYHGKQVMTVVLDDLVSTDDDGLPEETEAWVHRRDTMKRLSETHPAFHAGGIVLSPPRLI